ncbi:MAG: TrbG/VirB9 family P-type conjugative transfer protein [Burkholderiaceae bacterium]|nr:TrbG/VirB9 family P-type conjugative transfer protein [Burkholderiaceae bacterium]
MRAIVLRWSASALAALFFGGAQADDPRLRDVVYDPHAVVTVPVKRGVVTHIILDADDALTDIGSGFGGDCGKPESAWCVAAQAGGRNIFVKPKSTASAPNNLAVVTDKRTYAFRFVVLDDSDKRPPVYRLTVRAPAARQAPVARSGPSVATAALALPFESPLPSPRELVAERLQARPEVVNSQYSIAQGEGSDDIVPTLVFDDGHFTYFRFPGNREVPAVFQVLADGSENLANARMEDDLLVVDRVSRRLMLRAGAAVVGVWNDAFDLDGVPPVAGTTVPGVQRVIRADAGQAERAASVRGPKHE